MSDALSLRRRRFDDLPVRPEPLFGESMPGYLWRLLNRNGHEYLNAPLAATMVQRQTTMCQSLMSFFGADRLALMHEAEAEQMKLLKRFERGAWLVNSHACRPCPECLRSTGAFMARQLLPLVSVCLEHGCWLMHRCPECFGSLPWRHIKLNWTCRCGGVLASAVTPQAPSWVIRLARWVQSGTGSWLAGLRNEIGAGDTDFERALPAFVAEPTRCFVATMNARLDQAYLLAVDHAPGETSARRLNRTMPHWRFPVDTNPRLLSAKEAEVVRFVLEDASMAASLEGARCQRVVA